MDNASCATDENYLGTELWARETDDGGETLLECITKVRGDGYPGRHASMACGTGCIAMTDDTSLLA